MESIVKTVQRLDSLTVSHELLPDMTSESDDEDVHMRLKEKCQNAFGNVARGIVHHRHCVLVSKISISAKFAETENQCTWDDGAARSERLTVPWMTRTTFVALCCLRSLVRRISCLKVFCSEQRQFRSDVESVHSDIAIFRWCGQSERWSCFFCLFPGASFL
jgi:hypothetical protein